MTPTFYRVEDYLTAAPVDEWDNPVGPGTVAFRLRRFIEVRKTPKGRTLAEVFGTGTYRAEDLRGPTRFQLDAARKVFAAPSIAEAVEHWKARKAKQSRIYRARLRAIENALALIDINARRWRKDEEPVHAPAPEGPPHRGEAGGI